MVGGYHIGLWSLLIAATICDLIWGKIFNWVNGLFLLGGLFTHFYLWGINGLYSPLAGIAVAFIFFFPLYLLKAFAAGDVKLLMAVGAWADPKLVLQLGVAAILVGAVVGLVTIVRAKGAKNVFGSLKKHLKTSPTEIRKEDGFRMPFAPAFLVGLFLIPIVEKYW